VSAARARRRLMAFERYRRRALLLGGGMVVDFVTPAHNRAWCHVDHLQQTRRSYPWMLSGPHRTPP
jgi:hypothetical protein